MTTPPNEEGKDAHNAGKERHAFGLPSPADILKKALKYSPLLIGWNDDRFREVVEEYRKEREEGSRSDDVDIEKIGFGPQHIINDAMKEIVYNRSGFDDLKSDWRKFEVSSSKKSDQKNDKEKEFNIREMKLYQNLLGSVKYQRDAYLMGENYAEDNRLRRAASDDMGTKKTLAFPFGPININKLTTYQQHLERQPTLPEITTASTQLTKLAQWFVPSPVMHNALLPIVLWTISPPPENGPLRIQAVRASSDLIPLSQPLLDKAMKNSVVWVLTNSNWRESIKGSTRGMVGRLQEEDDGNAGGNGRFVTTKTINLQK